MTIPDASATRHGFPARRRRGFPSDTRRSWGWTLGALTAGAIAWGAARMLASHPDVAESLYGPVAPVIGRSLSRVTGVLPFAVVEVALAAYLLWLAMRGVRALRGTHAGRRRWRNAFAGGALRLGRDAGVVVVLFYLLWGLNYPRPAFHERAGWPAWDGAEVEELIALAEGAVEATNLAYLELHGVEDIGHPTPLVPDARALNASLDEGWRRAVELLSLPASSARPYGPVKWPLAGPVLARLAISGIYVPFTAEAMVVRGAPAVSIPLSMAHEKAHQRGFARESDANFLGFVAAALAPDPLSRYAAGSFASGQLLGELSRSAPDDYRRIVAHRLPGIVRDLEDRRDYWLRLQGRSTDLGSAMNDRYLRANSIAAGTRDYSHSVRLLIVHARRQEGKAIPPRPE